MGRSKPNEVLRGRVEFAIGIFAPLLDLLLAVGDRASRVLGSEDPDHAPARVRHDGEYAPRGLGPHKRSQTR